MRNQKSQLSQNVNLKKQLQSLGNQPVNKLESISKLALNHLIIKKILSQILVSSQKDIQQKQLIAKYMNSDSSQKINTLINQIGQVLYKQYQLNKSLNEQIDLKPTQMDYLMPMIIQIIQTKKQKLSNSSEFQNSLNLFKTGKQKNQSCNIFSTKNVKNINNQISISDISHITIQKTSTNDFNLPCGTIDSLLKLKKQIVI